MSRTQSGSCPRRCRAAFTLVELLVVIGIIALLISILLPALNRARASANSVKCLSNLRSIGQALMIYTNQSKGSYPYGLWDGVGNKVNGVVEYPAVDGTSDWMTLLVGNALGGPDKGSKFNEVITVNNQRMQQLFACPAAVETDGRSIRTLHYSAHPRVMPDIDQADPAIPAASAPLMSRLMQPYKVGKLKRSAEIMVIFDGIQIMNGDGNALPCAKGLDSNALFQAPTAGASFHKSNYLVDNGNIDFWGQAVFTPNEDFYKLPYDGERMSGLRWRHLKNNSANMIFADGHGETRGLKPKINAEVTARNIYVNPNR